MEIYVSTDVETDGPIPGPHSMLSFGSAAYRADKTLLGTFAANLETLPGAGGHPDTMAWWRRSPRPGTPAAQDLRDPAAAMAAYVAWLEALPGTAGLRRLPGRLRLPVRLLVPDPLRRREPVLLLGPRHQDLRHGPARHATTAPPPRATMPKRWFDASRTPTWRSTTRSSRGRCSATCWPRRGGGQGSGSPRGAAAQRAVHFASLEPRK